MPLCIGTTKAGTPCRTEFGLSPDGLCLMHDPARQDRVNEIRRAGGQASGAKKQQGKVTRLTLAQSDVPPMPETLDDATKYFAWIINAIGTGRLDARSGHEMAYSLNGFKAAAEKRDMEREIKALRAELAAARTGPKRVS